MFTNIFKIAGTIIAGGILGVCFLLLVHLTIEAVTQELDMREQQVESLANDDSRSYRFIK